MKLSQPDSKLSIQLIQLGENLACRWVLNTLVLGFGVLVKTEVVLVIDYFLLGNKEALLSTLALRLGTKVRPACKNIGDIVVLLIQITRLSSSV